MQAWALIVVATTVTAVLTFAFAPISLFFLITARSYAFFKLLNVAILTLTALVGLRSLTSGMRALNEHAVVESTISHQVVMPVPLAQRELIPVTLGGAAEAATQRPTNGDTPADRPRPNHMSVRAADDVTANPSSSTSDERPASMILLYIWILLFGLVGTQLAWTLRARSSAARVRRSSCSAISAARSTATSWAHWAICSADRIPFGTRSRRGRRVRPTAEVSWGSDCGMKPPT